MLAHNISIRIEWTRQTTVFLPPGLFGTTENIANYLGSLNLVSTWVVSARNNCHLVGYKATLYLIHYLRTSSFSILHSLIVFLKQVVRVPCEETHSIADKEKIYHDIVAKISYLYIYIFFFDIHIYIYIFPLPGKPGTTEKDITPLEQCFEASHLTHPRGENG